MEKSTKDDGGGGGNNDDNNDSSAGESSDSGYDGEDEDEITSLYALIEGYKKSLADLENDLTISKANEDFQKDRTKFEHALLVDCRNLLGHCQGQRDNIQALLQTSTQQVATLQQQVADLQQQFESIVAPAAGGARKTRRKRRRKRRRRKRKTRRRN